MDIWQQLEESLLREAALQDLLRYVTLKWGENEADWLRNKLIRVPLKHVPAFVTKRYVDPKADTLAAKIPAEYKDWDTKSEPQAREPKKSTNAPAPSERPRDDGSHAPSLDAPWRALNKMQNAPKVQPAPEQPGPEAWGDEPTSPDAKVQPDEPEASPEEDPRDLLPGAQKLPRATGFSDPAQLKGTKAGQSSAAAPQQRTPAGKSAVRDLQKRLWQFAQVYGPQSTDDPETTAKKQQLLQRMSKKYGVPIPDTDDNGRPKIMGADQLARSKADELPGTRQPKTSHKPPFRGTFVGQVWRPSGVSKPQDVWYSDAATGQMNRRRLETNPKFEGDEMVWAGDDWIPASAFVTKMGAIKARTSPAPVQPEPQLPAWMRAKR